LWTEYSNSNSTISKNKQIDVLSSSNSERYDSDADKEWKKSSESPATADISEFTARTTRTRHWKRTTSYKKWRTKK